ncbi:MAG: hypothetical protein FJX68_08500 [Alphaproteobacteria bacterium]|nr:hypothetical protein [Alphaproteobacteria bacterium]
MRGELRRLLELGGAAGALTLPTALLCLVLLQAGKLAPWPAFAICLTGFLTAVLLLRQPLRKLAGLAEDLAGLAAGRPAGGFADALGQDLEQAGRQLRERLDSLATAAEIGALRAEAILRALPEPALSLAADGRIRLANPTIEELFGVGLPGRQLAEAIRSPQVLEAADAVLAGAEAREVEVRLAAPVEREFACRLVRLARPLPGESVALMLLRDLTQLRRSEQMRADFVANASHEIRTPLATLVACVETLSDSARDDPAAQSRFLAIMSEQANRMSRLVEDLLSLSRIELNEHTPPTGRVKLGEVLARVLDGLRLKAEELDVTVALETAADLPPALGDVDELEQVFQNLMDNALKYGRDGKRVEITAALADRILPDVPLARRGAALRIAIRDFGPGIAREHLPRLTERFYRVDNARSRALGGTGLGLAIVKHIVNRHRGVLTIDSSPGQGSTFTVYLPAPPA